MRKTLDPNLASILDSIRATVGGEAAPEESFGDRVPDVVPEPEELAEPADSAPKAARPRRAPQAAAPSAPLPQGQRSVEEFLADLIRPQVDEWLKANLPELVQKMAAEEIARLTGRK
jgi:cell pole-organizing protein PopZ